MNKRSTILSLTILLLSLGLQAQQDTIRLHVRSDVSTHSIRLRWATDSPEAWYFTNRKGVTIERYTLVRDGKVLDTPEKKVLTPVPLKPPALNVWQRIALEDSYAAIIAQALYGKEFEISGGRKGVGEMIALSQEQEQRYAMALYAADLSFPAALFAGWGYEDLTALKGERYLYRIIPVGDKTKKHLETASAYLSLDDYEPLPQPLELDALFGNASVLLTWNYQLLLSHYNTYYVERSDDGKRFVRLNDTPLLNITESDRIFYTDSIQNNKTYYYRVIGLTPFGEEGPASDTISGMGKEKLIYIPHIVRVVPHDNGSVGVEWDFNEVGDKDMRCFELQRSDSDKGPFEPVVKEIAPGKRSVVYSQPLPENYLRIAAIPKEGEPTYSFPYLVQMADSIPPAIPEGLLGEVDSLGVVRLVWKENTEPDLLGYRLYRGQTKGEELIPLNDVAIRDNAFTDTLSLENLNARVYYAVTALDRRYNQSGQSEVLTLQKPLKVKPAPPYLSTCEADDLCVRLVWIPGRDEAVTAYSILRTESQVEEWQEIARVEDASICSYADSTVLDQVTYRYQVCSVNQSGLVSDPSPARSVVANGKANVSLIKKFEGKRTDRGILLKWELTSRDIRSISVYRKEPEASFYLWREMDSWANETLDEKAMRNTVYEYMVVVKDRQGRLVSGQIKVN